MISEQKVEVLKDFQLSIYEYRLSMQLYSDSFLKITLLSLQSLDYFESKLNASNIGEHYKGIFNETAELYDYTVANIRDALVDPSGILVLPDTSGKQENIKITVEKQTRYKYEVLWLKLLQSKKDLGSQLARNGDKDLKRYDEIRGQLDSLRRASNDDRARLDNLQKNTTKQKESFDKFSLENKSKLEALDKKISLFKANIEASQQEDKSAISTIEGKVDDLKKFSEDKFTENKNKIRSFDYKLVDLEQNLTKVKDELASKSECLTQADDDLKCSIRKLRADTQEQIENLEKKLKTTSQRIPAEDTTIIIRDYKRASDEIRRILDKFMGETKANIDALNIKDAQIIKNNEEKVACSTTQITSLQQKISEITNNCDQSQSELRERLKKVEEMSNSIAEGIEKTNGQLRQKTESLSHEDGLIRQQITKIVVQLKSLNDFRAQEERNISKLTLQSDNLAKQLENLNIFLTNLYSQLKKVEEKCPVEKVTLIEKSIEEIRASFEKNKAEINVHVQFLFNKIDQQSKKQVDIVRTQLSSLKSLIESVSVQVKKLDSKGASEETIVLSKKMEVLQQSFERFVSETATNIHSLSLKQVENTKNIEFRLDQTVSQIAKIEVNISEICKANSHSQAEWKEKVKALEEKHTQIVGVIDAIKSESKSKFASNQQVLTLIKQDITQINGSINAIKSELKGKFASLETVITLIKEEIQKIKEEIKGLNDYMTDAKSKADNLSQQTEGLRKEISQSKGHIEALQKVIKKSLQKDPAEESNLIKEQKRIIDELRQNFDKFILETKFSIDALNAKNTQIIRFMGETNAFIKNLNTRHTDIVKKMDGKGAETQDSIRELFIKISGFNKFIVRFDAEAKARQELSNKIAEQAKKEKHLQTKIESLSHLTHDFAALKENVEKLSKESVVIKEQRVQVRSQSPWNKLSILIILIIIGLTSFTTHFLGRSEKHHHHDS